MLANRWMFGISPSDHVNYHLLVDIFLSVLPALIRIVYVANAHLICIIAYRSEIARRPTFHI